MIHVLVFTDGRRECFEKTMASFRERVTGSIGWTTVVDDSDDSDYATWLATFGHPVVHHVGRRGFAGAIQSGWAHVDPSATHVFHLEDDFTFNEPVDLDALATAVDDHHELAQVVLKRQPWNDQERAAGGIVECWPDEYAEDESGQYTSHRLFWSTNPGLYRAAFTEWGWPSGPGSERTFSDAVFARGYSCAFWGGKHDPPLVTHIGSERNGTGY